MTTSTADPAQPTVSTVVVAADGSVTVTQVSNDTTVTYPGVVETGFSPINLSPALWLDASDETTITESGGAVSQWDDKSGNGNDFSQGTAALQPTTGTRTINGLNTLDFDADLLVNSPVTLSGAQPITVFVVAEPDADQYGRLLRAAGNTSEMSAAYLTSGRMIESAGTNLISSGSDYSGGTPYISRFTFDSTSSSIHLNGISVASGDAGTTDLDNRTVMNFGGLDASTQQFNGKIGEVIVCADGALTADEITLVEDYLTEKWLPVPIQVGAVAWYDASDESTITESGGAVSQWDDKSGNGNDLTQATSANQPTSGIRTLNGRNVLDFDGTDLIASSAFPVALSQPNTVIMVAKFDALSANRTALDGLSAGRHIVRSNSSNEYAIWAGTFVTGGTSDVDPHLLRGLFDGANSSLHVDGVSTLSGDAGAQSLTGLTLGATYSGASALIGAIAEVVIVDGTLTADQISQVETYLADKWGITL